MIRKTIDIAADVLASLADLFPDSSRTSLRQMLQGGRVRVNGQIEKNARAALDPGDVLEVGQKTAEKSSLPPELSVLHEDDDLIVVLKAHGLLTVATEREREATAQAYLNNYLKEKRMGRIHVVHRLDRETSGVLVFAKNFETREKLKAQFAAHAADRVYVAMIEKTIDPPRGTFQSHLRERRDLRMESVRTPSEHSKFAITHYRTVACNGEYSMLEITLETGRKNQIRTHLAEAGHPVIGDRLYGSDVNPLGRLGLHAQLLGFMHPSTGKQMRFTAPVPKAFLRLVGEGS